MAIAAYALFVEGDVRDACVIKTASADLFHWSVSHVLRYFLGKKDDLIVCLRWNGIMEIVLVRLFFLC